MNEAVHPEDAEVVERQPDEGVFLQQPPPGALEGIGVESLSVERMAAADIDVDRAVFLKGAGDGGYLNAKGLIVSPKAIADAAAANGTGMTALNGAELK